MTIIKGLYWNYIAHMRKCEVSGSHVIAKSTALHAATFGEYRFLLKIEFVSIYNDTDRHPIVWSEGKS